MPNRVFVSCGQDTETERQLATTVRDLFQRRGFQPYVAVKSQSIQDVNSGIIDELKRADYYVFIDFRRQRISGSRWWRPQYRGSLFTNQELAIAYMLGFEKVLFFQQKGIRREGLLQYVAGNAAPFDRIEELPELVERTLDERLNNGDWSTDYTRHLVAENLKWADHIIHYSDHTGDRWVWPLYVDIRNVRRDLPATNTVARLAFITSPSGVREPCPDRSHLKVTGHLGAYSQVIWPESHGAFDLLSIDANEALRVFLNSSLDVPRQPIFTGCGEYRLDYEVLGENFPVLRFSVHLGLTGDLSSKSARLVTR